MLGRIRPADAIRLLLFTGARFSEITGLRWDWIRGIRAVLPDSKTGPRTLWLGSEATRLLATLPRPEGTVRVFPENLTSARLYTFWIGICEEAGLPGLRIHDCRHTWASQGVMNGVGLTTVGRLLGHRQRETTAIYAHLDDAALREAAVQAAAVVTRAMGYRAEPPSLPAEENGADAGKASDWLGGGETPTAPPGPREPLWFKAWHERPDRTEGEPGREDPARHDVLDWLGGRPAAPSSGEPAKDERKTKRLDRDKLDWM